MHQGEIHVISANGVAGCCATSVVYKFQLPIGSLANSHTDNKLYY